MPAERRRLEERAEKEKAEKASRELDEPNLPTQPTHLEEPVALLEMEDARRIITRQTKKNVDAAETEPKRRNGVADDAERRQNIDETGAEEDPIAPARARAAATRGGHETRRRNSRAPLTWTEAVQCVGPGGGPGRKHPEADRRRSAPLRGAPRFSRVPAEASAARSKSRNPEISKRRRL